MLKLIHCIETHVKFFCISNNTWCRLGMSQFVKHRGRATKKKGGGTKQTTDGDLGQHPLSLQALLKI